MFSPATDPTCGAARLLRGVLVGTGGVSVSVAAHLAAGGRIPADGAFVSIASVAVALCWWLSECRWTWTRLVGALLVVQSALHLTLSMPDAGSGGLMFAAHAGATAVVARLLLSGEAWAWRLADAVTVRLPVVLVEVARPRAGRPLLAWTAGPSITAAGVRGLPGRRGPPCPAAVS